MPASWCTMNGHEPALNERGELPSIHTPWKFYIDQQTFRFAMCKHCSCLYGIPQDEAYAIEAKSRRPR